MISRLVAPSRILFRRVALTPRIFSSQVSEHYRKDLPDSLQTPQIEDEENFFSLAWHYTKLLLLIGGTCFAFKTCFTTLVIGRSMAPQFNSGASDYSDTVIFGKLQKSNKTIWLQCENLDFRYKLHAYACKLTVLFMSNKSL